MSKDYYLFKYESGESAFMAGIVDVLAGKLSGVCNWYVTFEADVFFIKENNLSLLDNCVKRRLFQLYHDVEPHYFSKNCIRRLHFELKPVNADIRKYAVDKFSRYSSSDGLTEAVNSFFDDLAYYLKEPLLIYELDKGVYPSISGILGKLYLWALFECFFVAYDEWMVLFMIGTVE